MLKARGYIKMDKKTILHGRLTKLIGSALFGYELAISGKPPLQTKDEIENAWIDRYRGVNKFNSPFEYPLFNKTVNGIVCSLMYEFDNIDKTTNLNSCQLDKYASNNRARTEQMKSMVDNLCDNIESNSFACSNTDIDTKVYSGLVNIITKEILDGLDGCE